jgi:hypothetical protein
LVGTQNMLGDAMKYPFSFGFIVTDREHRPITGAPLDEVVDALMAAMLERETNLTYDSSVGVSLASGEVDVELEVSARDEASAAALARDFVVQSILATGGTPIGLFVFPPRTPQVSPHQEWHERRAELVHT